MTTQLTRFSLVPQTYDQAMHAAEVFAKSGMVPKLYENQPNKIVVAWELGSSLGLGLMQSLQGIAVINGNPAVWGDTALAVVRASGFLEEIKETIDGKIGDLSAVATCIIKRKGEPQIVTTFSMQEAKQAGLVGKTGPWTQYPKRMLQLRARGFALRDAFADVLKGLKIAEEVQDYNDLSTKYPDAIQSEPAPTTEGRPETFSAAQSEPEDKKPRKRKADDSEPKSEGISCPITGEYLDPPVTHEEAAEAVESGLSVAELREIPKPQ